MKKIVSQIINKSDTIDGFGHLGNKRAFKNKTDRTGEDRIKSILKPNTRYGDESKEINSRMSVN